MSPRPWQEQHASWIGRCLAPKHAAFIAVVSFTIMACIQLGISMGLLPVSIVWRSSFHELTLKLRIISVFAALILAGFAWIIWHRYRHPDRACQNWPSFLVTAYMVLNTVGNWLSPNPIERFGFGTLTLLLAACCFRVSTTTVLHNDDGRVSPRNNNDETVPTLLPQHDGSQPQPSNGATYSTFS